MSVTATFEVCEDIRVEANGKLTLVGLYQHSIVVPKLPFEIHQVTFLVKTRFPIGKPGQTENVRIEIPGSEDIIHEIPQELSPPSEDLILEGVKFHEINIRFRVSPFKLTDPGRIRVYVRANGKDIYAGSIIVTADKNEEVSGRDIFSAISIVALYAKNKNVVGEHSEEYAADLLNGLTETNLGKLNILEEIIFTPLPNNVFKFYFSNLKEEPPALKLSNLSKGYKGKIVKVTRFGGLIKFRPSEPQVKNFSIDILDEKIRKKKSKKSKKKKI